MNEETALQSPHIRVLLALAWPFAIAGIASAVLTSFGLFGNHNGAYLGALGVVSLLLGLRWYSPAELGLRGGRPFFSGASFAFLGWLVTLIARFIAIDLGQPTSSLGITFLFLLIFEAFCVQLWAFGTFFHAVSDWLNPISAAMLSGVLFGLSGWLLFAESRTASLAVLYFVSLGLFYAVIRLRSGSLLGSVLVQALQTLTIWHLFSLQNAEAIAYGWYYLIASAGFLLLGWRLRPTRQVDIRI